MSCPALGAEVEVWLRKTSSGAAVMPPGPAVPIGSMLPALPTCLLWGSGIRVVRDVAGFAFDEPMLKPWCHLSLGTITLAPSRPSRTMPATRRYEVVR
jgi:hypothetical protein